MHHIATPNTKQSKRPLQGNGMAAISKIEWLKVRIIKKHAWTI